MLQRLKYFNLKLLIFILMNLGARGIRRHVCFYTLPGNKNRSMLNYEIFFF